MAAYQYIYVMKGLTKIYPGGRKVLENIWLSFFPGAKIGVLGLNGAGKSTLLKIMAGLDKDVGGENWAAEGASVGYLHQEPQLDPSKDVQGNIMEGAAATATLDTARRAPHSRAMTNPEWSVAPYPLPLGGEAVHVWRAWLTPAPALRARLEATLSPDERVRADRLREPVHRDRFVVGRGVQRDILARYTGVPAAQIVSAVDNRLQAMPKVSGQTGGPGLGSSATKALDEGWKAAQNLKDEFLLEVTHTPLGVLAIMIGWTRWLELRLPQGRQRLPNGLWAVGLALIGVLLIFYRES